MKPSECAEKSHRRSGERGNVLFIILLAIVLIGALTAAIQSGNNSETANIDNETLLIRITEIQRYASELERAVNYVINNGVSENDIRFSHPSDTGPGPYPYEVYSDTENQVFAPSGGAAKYRSAPTEITASAWEFYGGTRIPQVGSDRTELVAVLPDVTLQFCEKINEINDLTGQPIDDGGTCVHGSTPRFATSQTFNPGTVNTMDVGSFTSLPAKQACVRCGTTGSYSYHLYHVLLAR